MLSKNSYQINNIMDVQSIMVGDGRELKSYKIDYDKVKTVRDVVDLFKLMNITFIHTSEEVEDAGDLLIEIEKVEIGKDGK